jgi:hypothetical protein
LIVDALKHKSVELLRDILLFGGFPQRVPYQFIQQDIPPLRF